MLWPVGGTISDCAEERIVETYLQHLDKGHAQVQVGQVSADQTQTEKCSNWYNGSKVNSASHLDRFAPIEKSCGFGHDLCHDGCKDKMP